MEEDIKSSIAILNKGGNLLYPSDSIWGIGCDALNIKAVEKIYKIKGRKAQKACIILVDSLEMLANYVDGIPAKAIPLLREDFERPLTIIYPITKNLPLDLLSEDGSIAIRVVKSGFAHELIKAFGKPITSTSANKSNEPTPYDYASIDITIKEKVDYIINPILDNSKGKPSKIVKFDEKGNLTVIRD
jgi:L-threonylcarbamoyladenylate synthase